MGLRKANSQQAVNLSGRFTLAFLPYAEGVQQMADDARTRGHEVMLHLPMAGRRTANPGPLAMFPDEAPAELAMRLKRNLDSFTGYTGVNNHMGSRFTEQGEGMNMVLTELKARGLFFIDSRTTARSAGRQVALATGLPFAERDVFLDNEADASHILLQLAQTEALARRHGTAIAIGHPHGATIDALARWQKDLAARGFDLVPASQIIEARKTPLWRVAIARSERGQSAAP
jgi:uncharacterized protein